jgi:hypothetical protein
LTFPGAHAFRASIAKKEEEVQYLPINLHVHAWALREAGDDHGPAPTSPGVASDRLTAAVAVTVTVATQRRYIILLRSGRRLHTAWGSSTAASSRSCTRSTVAPVRPSTLLWTVGHSC